MKDFTHFNQKGEAYMVDVGQKETTKRIARASGEIFLEASTLELITQQKIKKGDVLGIARTAGIMASKQTSSLIPLCHPIMINSVRIDISPAEDPPSLKIVSEVSTSGKTGVEMEALTAVSVTALTIYDMIKSIDRGVIISDVKLLFKSGGKSGQYEAS